jgi:hypothetical protein
MTSLVTSASRTLKIDTASGVADKDGRSVVQDDELDSIIVAALGGGETAKVDAQLGRDGQHAAGQKAPTHDAFN